MGKDPMRMDEPYSEAGEQADGGQQLSCQEKRNQSKQDRGFF